MITEADVTFEAAELQLSLEAVRAAVFMDAPIGSAEEIDELVAVIQENVTENKPEYTIHIAKRLVDIIVTAFAYVNYALTEMGLLLCNTLMEKLCTIFEIP